MGANWIVREAVETDETAVRCIYNACQAQGTWAEGNRKYTEKSIHSFFCRHKEQGEPLLVAQADGHVAGFALLWEFREWKTEEKTMEYAVYTDPDWRRQGVASLLLEAVKDEPAIFSAISIVPNANAVKTMYIVPFLAFITTSPLPDSYNAIKNNF